MEAYLIYSIDTVTEERAVIAVAANKAKADEECKKLTEAAKYIGAGYRFNYNTVRYVP